MRKKKPAGYWKIHQNCGVCQKPRMEKIKKQLHDHLIEQLEAEFERYCECVEKEDHNK